MRVNAVFGAGLAGKSYVVTRQRRLNCYYENRDDKDKSPLAVYGTPGMKPLFAVGSVSSPVRGMIASPTYLYAVAGSKFYQLLSSGTVNFSAPISSLGLLVSFSQNPQQVAFVDGNAGYVFSGGALTAITSAGFPNGCRTLANCSGYFIAESPNTQNFQVSAFQDATTWNPLSTNSAAQYPDILLAVDSLIGNLLLFSSTHLEFWQNVGAVPQPFQPILSATVEYGIAAVFSRAHVDNSICFLAQKQQGGLSVCQVKGYAVAPISTPDLESIFKSFPVVSDAVGLAYDADKHPMYQLTFPTANRSFLYDCSTTIWSETQTGLTSAYAQRHIGALATLFGGQQLVSDYATNQIYVPDANTFTDNGQTIKRELITRHHLADFNTFSIDEIYIDMETGVGLASGQGVNPMAALKISKDNGRTFLTERLKGFGPMGQYNPNSQRAIWRRGGSARVFTFDLYVTDPVKFVLTSGAQTTDERMQ